MSYNYNSIEIQKQSLNISNIDFEKESANFTKDSILSLKGSFILAQTTKTFEDSYKDLIN